MNDEEITLRDQFAMAAVAGLTADPKLEWSPYAFAATAYDVADAMMERRKWTPQDPLDVALQAVRDMPDDPEPANDVETKCGIVGCGLTTVSNSPWCWHHTADDEIF